MLDCSNDASRFRGCLYNKLDKETVPEEVAKFLAQNVPVSLSHESGSALPVDLHKWMDAVERNPYPKDLLVTQISSVSELKQRFQIVLASVI